MALAAEGVRARIYSCRKAFKTIGLQPLRALFHLRKRCFSASSLVMPTEPLNTGSLAPAPLALNPCCENSKWPSTKKVALSRVTLPSWPETCGTARQAANKKTCGTAAPGCGEGTQGTNLPVRGVPPEEMVS